MHLSSFWLVGEHDAFVGLWGERTFFVLELVGEYASPRKLPSGGT